MQTFAGGKRNSETQICPKTWRLLLVSPKIRLGHLFYSLIIHVGGHPRKKNSFLFFITLTWFFPRPLSIPFPTKQQMLCSFSRYQVCVVGFNLHQRMLHKNWHLTLNSHKPNLVPMPLQCTEGKSSSQSPTIKQTLYTFEVIMPLKM